MIRYVMLPTIILLLLSVLLIIGAYHSGTNVDLLIYAIGSGVQIHSMVLYDPSHDARVTFFKNVAFTHSELSVDGRLAYASEEAGSSDIYILHLLSASTPRINITQSPTVNEQPLAWSRDGRYLAFTSHAGATQRGIYIWDGVTITNITPDIPLGEIFSFPSVSWSHDNRLAFTVWHRLDERTKEIYLWDGSATVNLSQNPAGDDEFPAWNTDGRLAFLSERDDKYDILIWDGASHKNGAPDVESFINPAPGIPVYHSAPGWTPDGLLTFPSIGRQGYGVHIYVWDGRTTTNISENSDLNDYGATWGVDGRRAYVTFFAPTGATFFSPTILSVRDADNRTLLTVKEVNYPAWSLDGNLIFCKSTPSSEILFMWDGQTITEIDRGSNISAQWQNGSTSACSGGA